MNIDQLIVALIGASIVVYLSGKIGKGTGQTLGFQIVNTLISAATAALLYVKISAMFPGVYLLLALFAVTLILVALRAQAFALSLRQ